MLKKERAAFILERLTALYPETPVPLDHKDNFSLLVAVLLSAQCTDERVNKVTPALFDLADNPFDMQHVPFESIYKTAGVVMSQGFGNPAFPVDTHIHRLAQRWGLTKGKNVTQTEHDLKQLFHRDHWNSLHLQIIFYGREFCSARGCDGRVCDICTTCYPNRKNPFTAKKP